MNDRIDKLLSKIRSLEAEIESELETRRHQFHYKIEKNRIKFESEVIKRHKEFRLGIGGFLRESGFVKVIFAPVIYIQILPLALLDLGVTLFQFFIFSVYGISKVRRADYIVIDRHKLSYLNGIQKFNCIYCGYANGLLAYCREVAGRTEEYWCPIKHAWKTKGQHGRYVHFAEYGDVDGFLEKRKGGRD